MVCEYEFDEESKTITVNCMGCVYGSSIADYPMCMLTTIDKLTQNLNTQSVVFRRNREYEYDYEQVKKLIEVAKAIKTITRDKDLMTRSRVDFKNCERWVSDDFADLEEIIMDDLRKDPIGAYVKLKRKIRRLKSTLPDYPQGAKCYKQFIDNIMQPIQDIVEDLEIVQSAQGMLSGYDVGDRDIYREIFHPTIRPNFMLTKYMSRPPEKGEVIDRYTIRGGIEIEVYDVPEKIRYVYHVNPPEFDLNEDNYTILDAARRYMAAHKPRATEFTEPERMREVFSNIGSDMITDLADHMGVSLSKDKTEELTSILTRYTAGLGILEILLADKDVEDVYINSPVGTKPAFVRHADYGECETNLIPTQEDAEAWATRFRMTSGRPLDEANPVLDTETDVPGGRARVSIITRTLSPEGLGFALRRHRDKPWTYPLYLHPDINYFNSLFAGLMSFIIDGARTFLVAGTRSSGKSSLLGASMLEIMRKYRIVSVEDSVTGDSRIIVKRNGEIEKTTVGELIDGLVENNFVDEKLGRDLIRQDDLDEDIKVYSMDRDGKGNFKDVNSFIRHKTNKDIYRVETATGRELKVTGDHSLFGVGESEVLEEFKVNNLEEGNHIAVPRNYKIDNEKEKSINLLNHLEKLNDFYIIGKEISELIEDNWEKIKEVKEELGYSEKMHSFWKRKALLPVKMFRRLDIGTDELNLENIKIKPRRQGQPIPVKIPLDDKFLTLMGLWLADGCYDNRSVLFSVVEEELRDVVGSVADNLGLNVKRHSDTFTLILNSKLLKKIMRDILDLKGNSYTKEIPEWIYNLSKEQIAHVLKGIFSGDGCVSEKEIVIPLASDNLLHDLQTLLLNFNVILRRSNDRREDGTFNAGISSLKSHKAFKENIGILVKSKREKLEKLCSKVSTHDSSDIIPLNMNTKRELSQVVENFNTHDYITRKNNIGREHMKSIVSEVPQERSNLINPLEQLAHSDILWDKVVNVEKVEEEGEQYVYDFSVPGNENFVCENILAHNTLELPIRRMRDLGFNVERMKSRSVITRVETELPAEEAIRTALRLGDSSLIIGEVRSTEAKALYEAMRVGALANTVAGTIHGDSPYGVFDRVVNDLGVPPTSFKATDFVVVCNTLKGAGGLETYRRVMSISEVRKHWQEDPSQEGGFVDLMKYDAEDDELKPTDTLLNGESKILNEIASNVKEWAGDWGAVWGNINLRGKVKQAIVDYSMKTDNKELLEAPFVVKSNNKFHLIMSQLREEVGSIPPDRAYNMFEDWLEDQIKSDKWKEYTV